MHYSNGRPAKNGDRVVVVKGHNAGASGILHGATPGNDACNGNLAPLPHTYCNLSECLHAEDVAAAAAMYATATKPGDPPAAVDPVTGGRATDAPKT